MLILKIVNKTATLSKKKNNKFINIKQKNTDPFKNLENLIEGLKIKIPKNLPPMSSGVFGYLGYEAINYVEKISKNRKTNNLKMPDCLLFYPRSLFIYDNHKKSLFIIKAFIHGTYDKKDINYEKILSEINDDHKYIANYKYEKTAIDKRKRISLKSKSNISKANFYKISKNQKNILNKEIFFKLYQVIDLKWILITIQQNYIRF